MECIDGNTAAVHAAYGLSEVAFIYPITPSSTMSETADVWSAAEKKNCFGTVTKVTQLQSEAGAAGAVHGATACGSLATTFTSSQGLLLMIPNLYKLAGEMIPCVLHVAARQVGTGSTSIYCDHSDLMAIKQTGLCILSSHNVQEAADLAIVAHIAALNASLPFVHTFDGFQTSHCIQSAHLTPYEQINTLVPHDKIANFRMTALNPLEPHQRGVLTGRDDFMQSAEVLNEFYDRVPQIVDDVMEKVSKVTGRRFHLFEYHGAEDAEDVVVIMGAHALTVEEVVDFLTKKQNRKVGVVRVHLLRPFSIEHFVECLPKTVKRIAVMDRSKDIGAVCDPLAADIIAALAMNTVDKFDNNNNIKVFSGRYGLADKTLTPAMVIAVFDNLTLAATSPEKAKRRFTVGINDDVSRLSLPVGHEVDVDVGGNTKQCVFWGLGGDGTVGGNQMAIKTIGNNTNMFVQGQFFYSSHKTGGITVSHLRFGDHQLRGSYPVTNADFVAVHAFGYLAKFPCLAASKPNSILLLSVNVDDDDGVDVDAAVAAVLPENVKKTIAQKQLKVYTINAGKIARQCGLGNHTNIILQTVFWKLIEILPLEKAISITKQMVAKQFAKKGETIINNNISAIDKTLEKLHLLKYDEAAWKQIKDSPLEPLRITTNTLKSLNNTNSISTINVASTPRSFHDDVKMLVSAQRGDELPVSMFKKHFIGGRQRVGLTTTEKRGVGNGIFPRWEKQKCLQCHLCVAVCPHAAIRPFVLTTKQKQTIEAETKNSDKVSFGTVPVKGVAKEISGDNNANISDYHYRLQVFPLDCTSCSQCVNICPAKCLAFDNTINNDKNVDGDTVTNTEADYADVLAANAKVFTQNATKLGFLSRIDLGDSEVIKRVDAATENLRADNEKITNGEVCFEATKNNVKSVGFVEPLFEFSGACGGCGETPYIKMLTQLFGEHNVICCASGCNVAYSYSLAGAPYKTNSSSLCGPSTAHSLFEDAAEFIFGAQQAVEKRRNDVIVSIDKMLADNNANIPNNIRDKMAVWLKVAKADSKQTLAASLQMVNMIKSAPTSTPDLQNLLYLSNLLPKTSFWVLGGDGWSSDIGYGGVDHVVASGANVKMLIVDTEVYSNTGGQKSKATPQGSVHKFESGGKISPKKELALLLHHYKHVYVAQVALYANPQHTLTVLKEAENFDGPAVVVCYAPCIEHGIDNKNWIKQTKTIVECGYWPLFRYQPDTDKFIYDSPTVLKDSLGEVLKHENRFMRLSRERPEKAEMLHAQLKKYIQERHDMLLGMANKK